MMDAERVNKNEASARKHFEVVGTT
jgi:hypothetical protein